MQTQTKWRPVYPDAIVTKTFILTLTCFAIGFSPLVCLTANAASRIDEIEMDDQVTSEGHSVQFGDGFLKAKDLSDHDPLMRLLRLNSYDTENANQTVYLGRSRYEVGISSSLLGRSFFEDIRYLSYLLGPSNQLKLLSTNPFRLACEKSVIFGITVRSQETIQVFELSDLQVNPPLEAIVREFNQRREPPERVVIQSFDHFSDYFDSGVMLTLIYNDGPEKTGIDLVSVSLINSIPLLIGKDFISNTSRHDLHYFVDRLSAMQSQW